MAALEVTHSDLIEDLIRYGGHDGAHWRGKYPDMTPAMVVEAMELSDECPECCERFIFITERHSPSCGVPEYISGAAHGG